MSDTADLAFEFDPGNAVLGVHFVYVVTDGRAVVAPEEPLRGIHVGEDEFDRPGFRTVVLAGSNRALAVAIAKGTLLVFIGSHKSFAFFCA